MRSSKWWDERITDAVGYHSAEPREVRFSTVVFKGGHWRYLDTTILCKWDSASQTWRSPSKLLHHVDAILPRKMTKVEAREHLGIVWGGQSECDDA